MKNITFFENCRYIIFVNCIKLIFSPFYLLGERLLTLNFQKATFVKTFFMNFHLLLICWQDIASQSLVVLGDLKVLNSAIKIIVLCGPDSI